MDVAFGDVQVEAAAILDDAAHGLVNGGKVLQQVAQNLLLLARTRGIALTSAAPWPPRQGLHVHGPDRLPIHFEVVPPVGGAA